MKQGRRQGRDGMTDIKREVVRKRACLHCGSPKLFPCWSRFLDRVMVNQVHEVRLSVKAVKGDCFACRSGGVIPG